MCVCVCVCMLGSQQDSAVHTRSVVIEFERFILVFLALSHTHTSTPSHTTHDTHKTSGKNIHHISHTLSHTASRIKTASHTHTTSHAAPHTTSSPHTQTTSHTASHGLKIVLQILRQIANIDVCATVGALCAGLVFKMQVMCVCMYVCMVIQYSLFCFIIYLLVC